MGYPILDGLRIDLGRMDINGHEWKVWQRIDIFGHDYRTYFDICIPSRPYDLTKDIVLDVRKMRKFLRENQNQAAVWNLVTRLAGRDDPEEIEHQIKTCVIGVSQLDCHYNKGDLSDTSYRLEPSRKSKKPKKRKK